MQSAKKDYTLREIQRLLKGAHTFSKLTNNNR